MFPLDKLEKSAALLRDLCASKELQFSKDVFMWLHFLISVACPFGGKPTAGQDFQVQANAAGGDVFSVYLLAMVCAKMAI